MTDSRRTSISNILPAALIGGLLCLNAGAASAGDAPDVDCNNAMNTVEMRYCASQDYEREDARLNEVYKRLMAEMDKQGKDYLRDAQRAWIPFRDKNCAVHGDRARGGTAQPLLVVSCLAEMTSVRADELEALEGMQ